MQVRDPTTTELNFRPEITADELAMLVEWAVKQKYSGRIRARGTDPADPGSTFWELQAPIRIVASPLQQRLWVIHPKNPNSDTDRIIRFLETVLATHPPTRHQHRR